MSPSSTRCIGTRRVAWIDRPLVCLTPIAAEHWRCWLGQHGLDPNRVCLDQAIRCDDSECTISCQVWPVGTPTAQSDLVRRELILKLTAPALPFPEDTAYATWTCELDEDEDEDEDASEVDGNYLLAA